MDKGQTEIKKNNWLTNFLFTHTRQTIPDGRPLYAYKCNDQKYLELKEQLIQQQKYLDYNRASATQFPYYFCLYAAETFCREHDGGVWTWDTVFEPLGKRPPPQPIIAEWVEIGLRWWKRKLIIGQHGDRRLLTTIACEGGLPLKLLHNDNANLYKFFRTVLESYHAHGYGGVEIAETLARYHSFRLPASLRQDVVFRLGAELVSAVVELQSEIGSQQDPMTALAEKVPDWRVRLPLRVEEQVAKTLFNGLVIRTDELVRAAKARLRWRGRLVQTPTGWQIQKCLELPESFSAEQINQWIALGHTTHPRLCLLLNTPKGTENIAVLTLSGISAENTCYRREWLKRGGLVLFDKAVMDEHSLCLHDGQREYPLNIEYGEPWGDSPWLFIQKSTSGNLEFFGEGSIHTREESAWVLANPSLVLQAKDAQNCENLGQFTDIERIVYRIEGTVEFLNPDGDRYRMVCKAADDSNESFKIVGSTLNGSLNRNLLYKGLPQITKGIRNSQPNYRTQWRPINHTGNWHEGEKGCVGRIWLRLLDVAENIEIFRRQVSVLPKSFRIETVIGEATTPGIYRFFGLSDALVSIHSGQLACDIIKLPDGVEISCPLLQITTLPEINVDLTWSTGTLSIHLPYPQRGAVFQLAGQLLQRDDIIPLDRLGGLRLLLQDEIGGRRYWLNAQLITNNSVDTGLPKLQFRDRLPELLSGRLDTTLLVWQDRITSLLNSSRSLDAYVRLEVSTKNSDSLVRLQIARFDCSLEPNRLANFVFFGAETISRIGTDWQQRIRLEMVPLWEPTRAPILLNVNPERIACWNIPDDLQPGPWWIIGRDGNWARFRPLLWGVKNHELPSVNGGNTSALVAAIRESKADQREMLLNESLLELGQNPEHPDWLKLFDLIRLSREFPTSSLDVLAQLVSFPQTLALALLKADEEELFNCVWALAEQMPFSWSLLSVECWQQATALYYKSLRTALGEIDANGDIVFSIFQKFRDRVCTKREYWIGLCDWLQMQIFLNRPLQQSPLQIARIRPDIFDEHIKRAEQELQNRHDADEQWPLSDEVMLRVQEVIAEHNQYRRLSLPYRAVRCAPFVAASLSIKGMAAAKKFITEVQDSNWVDLRKLHPYAVTDNLIYELRLIRSFDPEWFDAIYAIALTLELSRLPLEITV